MSYALIVHRENNNTDAGAVASSGVASDFLKRKLTDILVNQQFSLTENTVNAFRSSSVANPSQFDLNIGVYRIVAEVAFSFVSAAGDSCTSRAGLYNFTDTRFEYHYGGVIPIISTSGIAIEPSASANLTNGICYIDTQFEVTGSIKTFEIRQAVFKNGVGVGTSANSAGVKSKVTTGSHKEVYALIKLTRIS